MRKSNPFLQKGFKNQVGIGLYDSMSMTIQGTVNKTFLLLALLMSTAIFSWNVANNGESNLMGLIMFGLIGGLIFSLITIFKPAIAKYTAPIYAMLEGLVLGSLSAIFELSYPGIVINAVLLTVGILFFLLVLYSTRIIKVTQNFYLGVTAATMGIGFVYLISFILGFFGIEVPYLHSNGLIGIGISVFIVIIAALNLVLDFDFIENGSKNGLPKYMEWYGAFGLLVTLVWLYLEILRLLAKLRSRD